MLEDLAREPMSDANALTLIVSLGGGVIHGKWRLAQSGEPRTPVS